jgi:Response regulator containing CheY-like receiver domain and AraC-type DNA-binding domain
MYKILISDDEYLERVALHHLIAKDLPDLEIVGEAENGVQAVELAKKCEPDIILMDIKMPGKSGLEAAREISAYRPETKIIILTAFDYFEYAQNALQIGVVEYLLKPIRPQVLKQALVNCINNLDNDKNLIIENKRIKNQLSQLWPYIKTSLVYDLISGNSIYEEELIKHTNILGIDIIPGIVMIIGIEESARQSTSEEEHRRIRQRVFEVVEDIFFADNPSILINPVMVNKYVVLVPCQSNIFADERYQYCEKKGQAIIRKLSKENIEISIGIGNYYKEPSMIQQSYLEAISAQRSASFAGGNEVVACNQIKDNKIVEFIDEIKLELLEFIYAEDWRETSKVLDSWWKRIRNSNLGEPLQKACILELLIVLYHGVAATELNSRSLAVLNLTTIENLINSNSIDELGKYFNKTVNEIIEIVKAGKNDSTASAIKKTLVFINANFAKEITLEDAARNVHVSPSYLSRIFSKEVGMPFKKYLVNTKLNHAKKLLLTTSIPINEIALDIGYQDTSYFCRIFKQEEGLSAKEYRMKNKQKPAN